MASDNSLTLAGAQSPTMSSREIAELVEKRHDNVKRTIDTLVERGIISQPQVEDGPKAANGVVEKQYLLGKRDSYVVVAQLSPEFTGRLVDRWQALEAAPAPRPLTHLETARMLVLSLERAEVAEAALSAAQPAIEFVARHVEVPVASIGFRDLAKHYKTPEPVLRQWLLDEKICFMQSVGSGRRLRPYKEVVMRGHAELKTAHSANGFPREDMYFTTSGQVWIDAKWQAAKGA